MLDTNFPYACRSKRHGKHALSPRPPSCCLNWPSPRKLVLVLFRVLSPRDHMVASDQCTDIEQKLATQSARAHPLLFGPLLHARSRSATHICHGDLVSMNVQHCLASGQVRTGKAIPKKEVTPSGCTTSKLFLSGTACSCSAAGHEWQPLRLASQ